MPGPEAIAEVVKIVLQSWVDVVGTVFIVGTSGIALWKVFRSQKPPPKK